MTTSDNIADLAAALAKAQASMKNAPLNKTNPHFRSKFADLASVRDTVIPALTANQIAVTQALNGASVVTRLMHASGQWIESECPLPPSPDMQKMGSAITYARRYSLSAICGIAADEDDDANAASEPGKAQRPQAVAKAPEGFEDWLADLEAVAQDGTQALQSVWSKSQPYLRKYLTDTAPEKWTALKAKAEAVKVPA